MKLLSGFIIGMILNVSVQAVTADNDPVPLNGASGITIGGDLLYVADTLHDIVRVVDITTGKMKMLPVSGPSFYRPGAVAVTGQTIFVGDSGRISKIEFSKNVASVLAGNGRSGTVDGVGVSASLNSPSALLVDGNILYVADGGNRNVRKIEISTGRVATLCGSGKKDSVDGPARVASLSPHGIAKAGSYLYVTDYENNNIRKIDIGTGYVSTFAGGGGKGYKGAGADDGIGTAASFNYPWGIATDGSNLYVADSQNNKLRKIVIATGAVSTLAGGGGQGRNGAGLSDGIGTNAAFYNPAGLTTDGNSLYVVDRDNNTIRKIDLATRMVTTVLQPVTTATSSAPRAKSLLEKADSGDVKAQYELGELYSDEAKKIEERINIDTPDHMQLYILDTAKKEKLRLAAQWYLKAAQRGHARAQYRVAQLSGDGIYPVAGMPEDFFKWYLKAAEQGVAEAEEVVGAYYFDGFRGGSYDIPPDPTEAFKWNMKAAKQQREDAQTLVGRAYEQGKGVTKDLAEAAKWYQKTAERGNILAQHSLGCLLANRSPSDYVQAFMWLEIVWSTPNGWDYGTACSDNAAQAMTLEQREKSKQLAREWSAKHQVVEH